MWAQKLITWKFSLIFYHLMLINASQKIDPVNTYQTLSGSRIQGLLCHMDSCCHHHLFCPTLIISEELSVTLSYMKNEFQCLVCPEVLKMQVRTMVCQHVTCRYPFLTAMPKSGIHCTLCCGRVTRRERTCPKWTLSLETS